MLHIFAGGGDQTTQPERMQDLIVTLLQSLTKPERTSNGIFRFSIDHCFPVKGQGTVLTGTVLSGHVSVDDMIELPMLLFFFLSFGAHMSRLQQTRKVKSMQMFRKPVKLASQGDRLGICVTQFDSKLLERGIACTPGSMQTAHGISIVPCNSLP